MLFLRWKPHVVSSIKQSSLLNLPSVKRLQHSQRHHDAASLFVHHEKVNLTLVKTSYRPCPSISHLTRVFSFPPHLPLFPFYTLTYLPLLSSLLPSPFFFFCFFPSHSPLFTSRLYFLQLYNNYLDSLYFVLKTTTSTGYGDISATNTDEMWIATFIMIVGKFMFGMVLAYVATLLANRSEEQTNYENMMQGVEARTHPPFFSPPLIPLSLSLRSA